MRIAARAPVRVEFGGGGTDIPSFSDKVGGFVLNATINKYAYATLQPTHHTDLKVIKTDTKKSILFRDTKDLQYNGDEDLIKAVIKTMKINYGSEIFLRSDVPPDCGLGSGATAAVTMVGLFNHLRHKEKMNDYQLAEEAYSIMRHELKLRGGKQSFYSSVFGGFNTIEFMGNGYTRVSPLRLKKNTINELEKSMLLVYVGKRSNGAGSQSLLRDQEAESRTQTSRMMLEKLKATAYEMKDALQSDNLREFGSLINKAFETKKVLNPAITTKKIEAISNLAKKHGALAARIQGAGGGGHMIIYCDTNKESVVAKKLQEKGIASIPYSFTNQGLDIWETTD